MFPEMWSDGYALPQEPSELEALAIDAGSDFVCAFGKLAEELQMVIGITFLEKHDRFFVGEKYECKRIFEHITFG
ncbi:MAG: hypothetical protein K5879_12070 [Lachnospiraceae bacterium]|nr:hypothetical protein [Lachnospiraceae bacterium]